MYHFAPRQPRARTCGPTALSLYVAFAGFCAMPAISLERASCASGTETDVDRLASYRLAVPVVGITKQNLRDTFSDRREGHQHEALDIPARRGTQVVAAGDGRVVKLFRSAAGGLTVYQFDPCEQFAYYYAHLDSYAQGLSEGKMLKRGELIGAVGSTGNAREDAPHLHFAIFKLGAEKRWWKGSPINAFLVLN